MPEPIEGPYIVEQLGYKKLAGFVSEVTIAGKGFLRIDVPDSKEGTLATQYISPDSIYALTPTTEEMVRSLAQSYQPQPVQRWELPAPTRSTSALVEQEFEDDE